MISVTNKSITSRELFPVSLDNNDSKSSRKNGAIIRNVDTQAEQITGTNSGENKLVASRELYTVSDSQGFIAAFRTKDIARRKLAKFIKLDLLWHKFMCSRDVRDGDLVYTLPYRNGGHLAFADVDPEVVKVIQQKLVKVEQVFSDDVKYWSFPIDEIVPDGLKRLSIWLMLATGLNDEQKKILEDNEKMLAEAAKHVEKDFESKPDSIDSNLTDCVVSDENVGTL